MGVGKIVDGAYDVGYGCGLLVLDLEGWLHLDQFFVLVVVAHVYLCNHLHGSFECVLEGGFAQVGHVEEDGEVVGDDVR